MTNEEMDRAIAEAVGWSAIEDRSVGLMMADGFSVWGYPPKGAVIGKKAPIPRFSTDLNAMHEAEHSLKYESSTWDAYCENLTSVCSGGHPFRENNIVAASARQRAEAFLRTIGKYHATHPLP